MHDTLDRSMRSISTYRYKVDRKCSVAGIDMVMSKPIPLPGSDLSVSDPASVNQIVLLAMFIVRAEIEELYLLQKVISDRGDDDVAEVVLATYKGAIADLKRRFGLIRKSGFNIPCSISACIESDEPIKYKLAAVRRWILCGEEPE